MKKMYYYLAFFTLVISIIYIISKTPYSHIFDKRKEIMINTEWHKEFWKRGVVLEIYPRSFYDYDGDGTGDLKGITAKSDYFVDLGVEMIWLTPILKSPMKDFGYDISDYKEIDPIFGTLEDFDNLIREMHLKGIKVIFDLVPNHTSDEHEWFKKSLKNDTKYKDYYVWKNPKGYDINGQPVPPNNWLSAFRYSAWEWSEERKQFYLHQYLKEQPDLNYRNPEVVEEMNNIVRFWLDRGVDGFRVDALQRLFEVDDVYGADEPVAIDSGITDPTIHKYLDHIYTRNQPETFEVTRGWYEILKSYEDRVMMVEVYDKDIQQVMKFYGNDSYTISDIPFNLLLNSKVRSAESMTGINLKNTIELWLNNMPKEKWPNWVMGSHDQKRVSTKFGKGMVDALNMFLLLLPGTPVSYYGEEIGMENVFISYEDTQDPAGCNRGPKEYTKSSRDPQRSPMQWDETKNAGFSTANKTWIPVNENYHTLNVKIQNETEQSHIKVYKDLTRLRLKRTFQFGTLNFQIATKDVLAFIRSCKECPMYLIVINTSKKDIIIDVQNGNVLLPDSATVVIRSSSDTRNETTVGSKLNLAKLSLIGEEGLVLLIDQ
ncbi:UNVERIFIED_CONTAM: hypothetical protein RMT77_010438 [Armadillidium vulgare]